MSIIPSATHRRPVASTFNKGIAYNEASFLSQGLRYPKCLLHMQNSIFSCLHPNHQLLRPNTETCREMQTNLFKPDTITATLLCAKFQKILKPALGIRISSLLTDSLKDFKFWVVYSSRLHVLPCVIAKVSGLILVTFSCDKISTHGR